MKKVCHSQIVAAREFGGISRYFCVVDSQVSRFPEAEAGIVAPPHVNRYLGLVTNRWVSRAAPWSARGSLGSKTMSDHDLMLKGIV